MSIQRLRLFVFLLLATLFANSFAAAQEVPLIPRAKFFGNPEKARARLSHDGKRLAYVAPVEGVLNVYVSSDDTAANAKAITFDKHRGITQYMWAYTNKHILYTQDKNGDEDNHVYVIDLASGKTTDLTPIEKIAAQIEGFSEKFPEEILVGINDRGERHYHDIWRINITTGAKKLVQENPGFAGFMTDDDYRVRLAMNFTQTGGQIFLQPTKDNPGEDDWKPYLEIGVLDSMTTSPAGFNKEGDKLYMLDSRNRNTAALKLMDIKSGKEELLAEDPRADISGAIAHPIQKTVQAVSYTYTRTQWKILDPAIQPDFDYLKTVADGELQITGRTLDDKRWTIAYLMDNGPVRFYIYDRAPERKVTYLFSSNPELEKLPLVKMHPQVIKSRDGLDLVSYLTLPKNSDPDGNGRPNEPLPMVLNVHGGPWARDDWGYDPEHQLLANRGYAVLSVNYRGSTGFGKDFINAADKQWAGKMHDDLIDAVNWAVEQKIARKDKVAITGGSYGGYATLVGLTFTPDVFACGVDVVGPSSLITLLSNPPPYWMPFMPVMKVRVGDHKSEEGIKFLNSRSPLNYVEKIKKPLLIGQGANDPRVKQPEADQIVKAMNEKKIPVTYVLFHDEGHGFSRPENRFAFYAVEEAFLAEHLGGRFEPIGEAFQGADFSVPSGTDQVPGLAEKMKGRPAASK
ncbi:alpha/beta hydrolase family protein [Anatilimnocola floriformis]|uniref:alpha/beta hydrolase family protein n=1 Tax=Anatilimnocola floriformis TaxID=2948575 RepID=UPI0020C4BD7B|nr:S9 family peptidase [Anatilimnocola floriformis]